MYRLLIVEDDVLIRMGLKSIVQWSEIGLSVCGEAQNGQEGLTLYNQMKPDIILTDIKMPVMDGLHMIGEIRKSDSRVRIIVLSSYDEFDLVRKAFVLGVSDYILKLKIMPDELKRLMKKMCEELAVQDQVASQEANDRAPRPPNAAIRTKAIKKRELMAAVTYIQEHFEDPDISLSQVAQIVGIHKNYLSKLFMKEMHIGFTDCVNNYRLEKAESLLLTSDMQVSEISLAVGIQDESYFSRLFKKLTGMRPGEYRRSRKEQMNHAEPQEGG